MDGGLLGALIGAGVVVLVAVIGGLFKYLLGRISTLTTSLDVAKATIAAKNETITELRQQISEFRVTARLQERWFGALPPSGPSGDR